MAKKTKALKEQVGNETPGKPRERAQELIREALVAAADSQGSSDSQRDAEKLLRQLEPIVSEYAPPPARVVRILEDKGMLKPASALRLERIPRQEVSRLSKNVYSDKRGERLARKKRSGWKRVNYQ